MQPLNWTRSTCGGGEFEHLFVRLRHGHGSSGRDSLPHRMSFVRLALGDLSTVRMLRLPVVGAVSIGVLTGLAACDAADQAPVAPQSAVLDHSHLNPIPLSGEHLHESPVMGRPLRLELSQDERVLWTVDLVGDPSLHALDLDTGELIVSVGRRGDGPGDFGAISGLYADFGGGDAVWAWDPTLRRLTRVEPRPLSEQDVLTLDLRNSSFPVQRIALLDPDRIVGHSMQAEEGRFGILSWDGHLLKVVPPRPGYLLGPDEGSIELRKRATDAGVVLRGWPSRGFAVANMTAGRIEMFDREAEFKRLADVPFQSGVVFERLDDGQETIVRDRSWYVDVAVADERMFALFSGRHRDAFSPEEAGAGVYVHVFDWLDGSLLEVFELDQAAGSIAVSRTGEWLYAVIPETARIRKYPIP